jgi:hypothetical protein
VCGYEGWLVESGHFPVDSVDISAIAPTS